MSDRPWWHSGQGGWDGPLPAVVILEPDYGAGLPLTSEDEGTAWIVSGLLPRTGVTVTTVEKDPQTAPLAAHGEWPQFVDLRVGDALSVVGEGGTFDPASGHDAGGAFGSHWHSGVFDLPVPGPRITG